MKDKKYVVWNNNTNLRKTVNELDYSIARFNSLFRFYAEHKTYNIKEIGS